MNTGTASTINLKSLLSSSCHCALAVAVAGIDYESEYLLLSSDEKARADRFKSDADRACYIVAHSLKRYCLSQLLDINPAFLTFAAGEKGKPFCEQTQTIDFNLSHSAGWVLLGISSRSNIGVDVEKADRTISKKVIAYALTDKQVLSIGEAGYEAGTSAKNAITYWTQKEAVSKAIGGGISVGFKNIECSGSLDIAKAYCNGQEFLMQSLCFNEIVFSVANLSNAPVGIYYLSRWGDENSDSLCLDKLL